MKNYLVGRLNSRSFIDDYLCVTQVKFTHAEADELRKEVSSILKKRYLREKPEILALRKNLDAWELHKNMMSWEEIYDKLHPGVNSSSKERAVRRLVTKATQIIRNLETGKNPWWSLTDRYVKVVGSK